MHWIRWLMTHGSKFLSSWLAICCHEAHTKEIHTWGIASEPTKLPLIYGILWGTWCSNKPIKKYKIIKKKLHVRLHVNISNSHHHPGTGDLNASATGPRDESTHHETSVARCWDAAQIQYLSFWMLLVRDQQIQVTSSDIEIMTLIYINVISLDHIYPQQSKRLPVDGTMTLTQLLPLKGTCWAPQTLLHRVPRKYRKSWNVAPLSWDCASAGTPW